MPLHASKRINHMLDKMNTNDLFVLIFDLLFFGLFLAAVIPALRGVHWGRWLAGSLLCELYLRRHIYGRKKNR